MKKLLNNLHEWAWETYFKVFEIVYSLCPIKRNKIVVTSYYGGDYGDNAKYIIEELKRQNADVDVVWQLKDGLMEKNNLPSGVRGVRYRSRQAVYELQTAGVWIDNARKTYGRKRKGQLYIQTWHGGPGVKRIEKDVADELGKKYVKTAKRDSKMTDVILSNSDFMTNLYKNVFWYNGEILECGTPRNDILYNGSEEISKKVRDFYNLPQDKKIVLYAPTFRKDHRLDVYNIDLERVNKTLAQKFGGSWAAFTRLHPNIADKADLIKTDGVNVINATLYPDMQELLCACDCLITDYSSSDVDYLLTKKPCFLYACDIEEYRDNRGYYFGFDDLPFTIAKDNDELSHHIKSFNFDEYYAKIKEFHQMTGVFDKGTACAAAAQLIIKSIK